MPDLHLFDSDAERRDAAQLSTAWNALVHGDVSAAASLDSADAVVIDRLDALARDPRPRPAFVDQLKEQLMDTSLPMTPGGSIHRPPTFSLVQPASESIPGRWRRLWHESRRGLSAVATVALLVVTLIGSYLAVSWSPPGGNDQGNTAGFAPGATPAAHASPEAGEDPRANCMAIDPLLGCPDPLRALGHGAAVGTALDVRQVQLQGWAISPDATVAGADVDGTARGVVVDFVLSGAYVATFDVPVVVAPGAVTNEQIEYLDPGETVELVRGDAVSYQLGGLVEIHNPLSGQRIEFKRAVIYEGDISAFSATADGVTTRVEGDATMPQTLGDVGESGAWITLWFLDLGFAPRGAVFPPRQWADHTVIGPVDPQRGPEGTEGFVLTIGPSMG